MSADGVKGSLSGRADEVRRYFGRSGTVSTWWDPERGPARHFYEQELRIFDQMVQPLARGVPVFDACTGRGRFAIRLAELGFTDVHASDISQEMLAIADERARGRNLTIDLRQDQAEELNTIPDGSAALICLMECFDHLPDPDLALRAAYTKLRPGGLLIATFVNDRSLYGRLFALYHKLLGERRAIAQTFTKAQFQKSLERNGFALVEAVGVQILNLPHTRVGPLRWLLLPFRVIGRVEAWTFSRYRHPLLVELSTTVVVSARSR